MSLRHGHPSLQFRGQLDIFSLFLIFSAFLIFLFQAVYWGFGGNPAGVIGFSLLIGGLVMGLLVNGFGSLTGRPSQVIDRDVTMFETGRIIYASVAAFIGILVVNLFIQGISPPSGAVSQMDVVNQKLTAVNFAIAEEVAFRFFLASFFIWAIGLFPGILISSAIWMFFHVFRYGYDPMLMMIVFTSGIILGFAFYLAGGKLTAVVLPHVLVNLIATPQILGSQSIFTQAALLVIVR